MRSPSFAHCLPSRSTDRPSDGNPSTRAPVPHPPDDTLHLRSVLGTPHFLRTRISSQQHARPSHHLPLTPRLDMQPLRQPSNSLYSIDSPLSLPTQYALGQPPWTLRRYDSRRQQNDPSHNTNYLRTTRDLDDHQRNSLPPHAFRQHQNTDCFVSVAGFKVTPRASSADIERDRQARACGQPPPLPASYGLRLNYALQHGTLPLPHYHVSQNNRRPEGDQRQHNPKTSAEPAKLQASRPKPYVLYSRLDQLVRRDQHRATDYISLDDVIELYRQEITSQEKIREKCRSKNEKRDTKFRVIGAPLRDVLIHASSAVTIGEHQHDIPTVVVACVEELTRTGIYQPGLFRTLPSRDRYIQLIDVYNSGADYGAKFSMHKQSMPDICAVLSTFISGLPHPLLDPRLYSGFWHWCVKPSVKREEVRRNQQDAEDENNSARGELPHLLRTSIKQRQQPKSQDDLHIGNDGDVECHQILIAEIILRFLPSSHLSLLIYLCGFFTQLPLCPENGIQFEDIARIYGPKVLGGTVKASSQMMMVWLLSRWHKISEGLLADACWVSQSPNSAQEELPHGDNMDDISPPQMIGGSHCSHSSDSDRSSSSSPHPCDQVESSTGRYRKKRSIESMSGSDDDEVPSRSRRPSRRHRLGRRNSAYAEHQKMTSMEDLPASANARVDPGPTSLDSISLEQASREPPDHPDLEARAGVTCPEVELLRNKTFTDDAARLLSEKVEQLDGTLGERMWHDASAPESIGLVTAAG